MAKINIVDTKDLNFSLVRFSNDSKDIWTLQDAVNGVQIFGGIGSGKSSGSGKTIAHAFLKANYGGLILTSKVSETIRWLEYGKKRNRLKDIIVFAERYALKEYKEKYPELDTTPQYFNPITYENTRPKEQGGGKTKNIVDLFLSIIRMGNRISGSGGGSSSDPFWDLALERLMTAAINLLKFALKGDEGNPNNPSEKFALNVTNLAKIVRHAPKQEEKKEENQDKKQINAEEEFIWDCMGYAKEYINQKEQKILSLSPLDDAYRDFIGEKEAYNLAINYFLYDFRVMPKDTRGSIAETFYAFANPFMSGLLSDYFSKETTPNHTSRKKLLKEKSSYWIFLLKNISILE